MKKLLILIAIFALCAIVLAGCTKPTLQTPQSTLSAPSPLVSGSPSSPAPTLIVPTIPATTSIVVPGTTTDVSSAPLQTDLPLKVTSPADAANLSSDIVIVKGQTQPGATVNVNDQVNAADGNGDFSISITLEEGPNAIDVISTDGNGLQGEVLLLVNVDLSQTPAISGNNAPTASVDSQGNLLLTITSPIDGATLNSAIVTVTGQTAPGATVDVNDQSTVADNNGKFSLPIDLNSGPNAIDVLAMDSNGNEGEVILMVTAG